MNVSSSSGAGGEFDVPIHVTTSINHHDTNNDITSSMTSRLDQGHSSRSPPPSSSSSSAAAAATTTTTTMSLAVTSQTLYQTRPLYQAALCRARVCDQPLVYYYPGLVTDDNPTEVARCRGVDATSLAADRVHVIVIRQTGPPVNKSFCWETALACFVCWLCGIILGGMAFTLTVMASSRWANADRKGARELGRASVVLSGVGLVVGLALWTCIVWCLVDAASTTYSGRPLDDPTVCAGYSCHGRCYAYSLPINTGRCQQIDPSLCFDNDYCYSDSKMNRFR